MSATAGFIRGSAGEVKLADILPLSLQTASTKARREEFAKKYEAEHPNVLVICDWEDIPDEVLVTLPEGEQTAALTARADLQKRREARKKLADDYKEPTLGMDIDRAAKELKRQRANLAGLTPDHPQYDKLFASSVSQIHELERICGEEPTHYEKGEPVKKVATSTSPEAMVAFDKYKKLSREKKKNAILAGASREAVALVRDHEEDSELQELAVMRLAQLEAMA